MRSSSIAFGDRHYEGNYNRLAIAGDAEITNSDVKKYIAPATFRFQSLPSEI